MPQECSNKTKNELAPYSNEIHRTLISPLICDHASQSEELGQLALWVVSYLLYVKLSVTSKHLLHT